VCSSDLTLAVADATLEQLREAIPGVVSANA
jgi:hypothetical protein